MSPPREKISHRICTINPLPVQQEQSTEEQPSFQTSLDCRGQTPVPPPKEETSSSVQKPLSLLCLLFMLLPLPLPNYHPVKLHSCGDFHLQTSARQVSTQPRTAGVNGSCRISHPPGAQLLFCQGVGFWRGISICPGFCQSEVLISEEEPKGRFETPRTGAARSLRDDAGPPRGAVQGGKPWSREKAAHICSPRGEWLLGVPGATGTQLQARYVQFASPSPSVGSWDGRQNTFVKRFQIQRFEDLEK